MVVRKPVPNLGVDLPSSTAPKNPPYPVTPTSPDPGAGDTHLISSTDSQANLSNPPKPQNADLSAINNAPVPPNREYSPWSERLVRRPKNNDLPTPLQIGESQPAQDVDGHAGTVPQALRPAGGITQITPRSSFESEGSSAPEVDADKKSTIREIQDERIIRAFSSSDGPHKALYKDAPNPSEAEVHDRPFRQTSASTDRPRTSSPTTQPQSRNPFRRKVSNATAPEASILPFDNSLSSFNSRPLKTESKAEEGESESTLSPSETLYRTYGSVNTTVGDSGLPSPYKQQRAGGAEHHIPPKDQLSQVWPRGPPILPEAQNSATPPSSLDQPTLISLSQDNPWTENSEDVLHRSVHKTESGSNLHTGQRIHITEPSTDLLSFDDGSATKVAVSEPNRISQDFKTSDENAAQLGPDPQSRASQSKLLSSSVVSEAELMKLREQSKETYQIKHFNWLDPRGRGLKKSSMLTQNQNGPCPLLALVNALILSIEDSALSKTLHSREQVTLGLIIESLMDELTTDTHGLAQGDLPDVDELTRFLLMLHTGMNANPKLASSSQPARNLIDAGNSMLHMPQSLNDDRRPGSFEETADVRLYSAFSIPLLHGWLPTRSDPAYQAFTRSAPTYEDAQTIQFGEEELEAKLSEIGLTADEQQLLQDIVSIRTFFKTYPTQLTPYGLTVISDSLYPGSFAILFRNDHFSTIYKHPDSGQLFALVTDTGFSTHDEVIWESLVDVSNKDSEFFSGDFCPVGNAPESALQQARSDPSSWNAKQGPNTPVPSRQLNQASHLNPVDQEIASPSSPLQEQADADYALALQLQDEEEARAQQSQSQNPSSRRRSSNQPPPQPPRPNRGNRASSQANEIRPLIPARRQTNVPVNRSAELENGEEAPPAYEEAAKRPAYQPPVGHPSHEGHTPTTPNPGRAGPTQQVSPVDARGYRGHGSTGVGMPGSGRRAFGEGRPSDGWRQAQAQNVGSGRNQKDRDKDCVVM